MLRRTAVTIGSFIAGVMLSALACSVYIDYLRTVRMSSVDLPMRTMLEQISAGLEDAEPSRPSAQMEILARRWREYLDGGPTPEQFMAEVGAPGISVAAAPQSVKQCPMAPAHVSITLPAQGFASAGDSETQCALEDGSEWTRMSASSRDLMVRADGPSGSGRYWTIAIGLAVPGGEAPDRGVCLDATTAGWRTLQHFEPGPLRWLDDVDGDGSPEVVIWDSFRLAGEPVAPAFGLVAWAYDLSDDDTLSIDWDSSRRVAQRLAAAYGERLDDADQQMMQFRRFAAAALQQFVDQRCVVDGGDRPVAGLAE